MWRHLVLVLVIWKHSISSHPTGDIDRQILIINGREVECCPCPSRSSPSRSADCPCADADGSPSMLLPMVMQPSRSANTNEPNEETKPLLHPEVDLASSMLETLREVTEEEYQDAVARDAARTAARNSLQESDSSNFRDSSDTSNLVTILVNPESNEDVVSEASELKEAHSSPGNERNNLSQPLSVLKKKAFDMDNAASTVQKTVAEINKGLEGLKFRSSKLLFPNKDQSKIVTKNAGLLSLSQSEGADETRAKNPFELLKVPNFRLNRPLNKIHEHVRPTNLGKFGAKKNTILESRSNEDDDAQGFDNGESPSYLQEQVAIQPLKKHKHLLEIPSLIGKNRGLLKKPFTLNTLWKLKDVELIPPKPIKTKINLPSLHLPPPVPKSFLGKTDPKSQIVGADKTASNILVIPQIKTNILDAVPSSSDNHINIVENVNQVETTTVSFDEVNFDPTVINSSESHLLLDSDEVVAENAHQLHGLLSSKKITDWKTPQGSFDYDESVESVSRDIALDGADYVDISQDDINIDPEVFIDTINNQDHSFLPSVGDETEIIIDSNASQIPKEIPVSIQFDPFEDPDIEKIDDSINFSNIQVSQNFRSSESDEPEIENNNFTDIGPEKITHLERSGETISESTEIIQDQNDDLSDMILDRQSIVEHENRQIDMKDLQQLSDSLLEASEQKSVKEDSVSDNNQCVIKQKSSIHFENVGINKNDASKDFEVSDINKAATNQERARVKITTDDFFSKEDNRANSIECEGTDKLSDLVGKSNQLAKNVIEKPNEMEIGASEQVRNISPQTRASLLPNVVQPLFEGNNLFGDDNFPLIPINRNLLNIPGIESLNPRLTDILGLKSKSADLSNEFVDALDCAEKAGKSSDASTGAQTLIPSFRPLEDLDLDIFRINPFSKNNALSAKMPTLNLNTFKTRLALPDSLGLRPIKLQSSFGNKKDGLLGATLTFGPDKLGSSKKGKSASHAKSALFSSLKNPTKILRPSLPTLPSLEELKDTMRSNTDNLLSSPLTSTLRSSPISSLSDNLRTHTENKMRNIQNSFTSRLNEVTKNPKYAQPESFLERFSSVREDLGDKLQAIQMDLTDRLSSAHDRIFDKDRLSSIALPRSESNSKSNTLQSTEPTGKFKIHKHPKTKSKSSVNSNKAQNEIKPFKMSKAASSLSPKTVEVPKLTSVSTEPTFTRPFQRELDAIKEIRAKSQEINQQRGASNKQAANKPKITSQKSPNKFSSSRPTSSVLNSRLKSDSRGFASESQPTVVPSKMRTKRPGNSLLQSLKNIPTPKSSTTDNKQNIQSERISSQKPVSKFSIKSSPSNVQKLATSPSGNLARNYIFKPITAPKSVLPKTTQTLTKILPQSEKSQTTVLPSSENQILSKLRDALRARFPNLNPKLLPTKANFDSKLRSDDMYRAASENNHVVAEGTPLKENVSYRCKMVCVKEPIENR